MKPLSATRRSAIDAPWHECSRFIASILTSEEWSGERAHLVGRTDLHFVVATRGVEFAEDSLLFHVLGDSPDLRHPIAGHVEISRDPEGTTTLEVVLTANMDEESPSHHLALREAIASLAETLVRTITQQVAGQV